jgi:hypothetical protein
MRLVAGASPKTRCQLKQLTGNEGGPFKPKNSLNEPPGKTHSLRPQRSALRFSRRCLKESRCVAFPVDVAHPNQKRLAWATPEGLTAFDRSGGTCGLAKRLLSILVGLNEFCVIHKE